MLAAMKSRTKQGRVRGQARYLLHYHDVPVRELKLGRMGLDTGYATMGCV